MKRQLNITDIAPFAVNNEFIAVRGNFAIIRNVASIKEQIVSGGMGDLLYIPLGRILLVTAGTVRLRLNMQPCQVEKGIVLVIPENYYMEVIGVSSDYNAQIVTFGGIPIPFKRWSSIPIKGDDSLRIGSYFDLLWEVANSPTCQQTTLNNLLSALLSDLYSLDVSGDALHASDAHTAADRLMQRFFDLLSESDGTVRSVKAVANQLCVSPNHLSAVVKQQSGQTVMQLLNAHTVLHAKILLRHSTLPLADIADRLGFENPPAFSRFFKRETGVTSGSVRNKR
ncbi:MAG: AraC family transcriptional regulator [Bacteroidales bacterium]|nr:AraC family transcriptional regulator [Bacteroidales bacterium]